MERLLTELLPAEAYFVAAAVDCIAAAAEAAEMLGDLAPQLVEMVS